jgi:hypothetical protein
MQRAVEVLANESRALHENARLALERGDRSPATSRSR